MENYAFLKGISLAQVLHPEWLLVFGDPQLRISYIIKGTNVQEIKLTFIIIQVQSQASDLACPIEWYHIKRDLNQLMDYYGSELLNLPRPNSSVYHMESLESSLHRNQLSSTSPLH